MTRENKGKKLTHLQLWDRAHITTVSKKEKGAVSIYYAEGHGNNGKYILALIFTMLCMHL